MLSSRHSKIALTIVGILISVGGFFSISQVSFGAVGTTFLNSEAFYAEMPSPMSKLTLSIISTKAVRVPILVYHIVRPSYPTDSPQVLALAQTPEVFDAQMKYLSDANYQVISFAMLENYLNKGIPLPENPVIISFDDGWSDQYTYAFPILQKYNYTATFFVFTNPINTRGFLTWDNLRTLVTSGMTIAAHSRSHPFLNKITNPAILWNEIDGSKKSLEKNLGITVHEFAYPFGQYNATSTAMVRKAGFTSARGDYVRKDGLQSEELLYELNAFNVPTTIELFMKKMKAL